MIKPLKSQSPRPQGPLSKPRIPPGLATRKPPMMTSAAPKASEPAKRLSDFEIELLAAWDS